MMRCPPFDYRAPTTVDELVAILAAEGERAKVIAGGTDLVPNMKRRHQNPPVLVALRGVNELRACDVRADGATLGAGLTLTALADDERLAPWRAFRLAAATVASAHIRNVATLGGNLCVDTRCNYYNQTYEWRKAIDFCMKTQGSTCWVAPGSPRCWAVSSTDTAPALIALGARVALVSSQGERVIELADMYNDDGIAYLHKRPDELLTRVELGDPAGWVSTYRKVRRRGSIDFPVLSVAAAIRRDGAGVVTGARLVFGAVASQPVVCDAADALVGQALSDEAIRDCAARASKVAKPLDNTDYSLSWRKKVARTTVETALRELAAT